MSSTVSAPPKDAAERSAPLMRLFLRWLAGWSRWAESRSVAYVFFAALYIAPNVWLARRKLIWDDEFFTLYLGKTTGWNDLWQALSTGADQHPPAFYYLTHLVFRLAGASHLTLRASALVGFGLCCVCLYEIARRLIGPRWAVPALLLPLTSPVLYYATEARGYGLELGLVTCALLMWVLAAEERKRHWAVPALAVSLALAVASHYYALLFVLPLAVGEFAKARVRRRIDVPVCCALSAAIIPLLLFAPIILRARAYSAHFWALPYWGSMLQWYPNMIGRMPLVLLAAAGLSFAARIPATEDPRESTARLSLPVVLAVTVCALLPVVGGLVAQLVTHAFTGRYFIAAIPGIVILLLWGLRRVMRNDSAGPALATVICLALFVQEWRDLRAVQVSDLQQLRSIATLLRREGDTPVVTSEVSVFHRLSFYARRDLANKLVYTADPHLSVQYIGQDTVDRGLLDLAPWFPLKIVRWHDWWSAHPYSLVYGYIGDWTWSTFALREIGTTELLARDINHLLFAVTRTKVPEDDSTPADPTGKPSLYDQLPTGGPPLCQIYLPDDSCPVVDDPKFKAPIISYPDLLSIQKKK
jgi:hypothetical protein